MSTSIKSTALDFNAIKTNLKTHFNTAEWNDFDFETSGLSNLLDVLAYNSHYNGLIANFALNESFLNSAQLRSSVVSHAENLGYYPRSSTCSNALITINIDTGSVQNGGSADTTTTNVTINSGSTFTANVDDTVREFQTTEDISATNDGTGKFSFTTAAGSTDIPIKEGKLKTKTFIVGNSTDDTIYIIPDSTMDTSTITVKVFETVAAGSDHIVYTNIKNTVSVKTDSTVYIIREVPNGYYEITFSEGNVLGKAPSTGNKIEVSYLSTKGPDGNGAASFVSSTPATYSIGGSGKYAVIKTQANSSGGADAESISSIKLNAPTAFAAQQRMVTAEDYKTIIFGKYSAILDDIICWGGQENVPATYGNTYVCLKFKDGVSSTTQIQTKDTIKAELSNNLAVMSIDTKFVDALDTYVEADVAFDFDPDLTGDSIETMQKIIKTKINEYFLNNLSLFGKIFRRSALLTVLDAISPAVLNSAITARVQRRVAAPTDFTLGKAGAIEIVFPVILGVPDDVNYTIQSTNFTFKGVSCFFRNKLSTTTLEIINIASGAVIDDNAGSYTQSTGVVKLDDAFDISAYEGSAIKVTATPNNQSTIKPLRNHILKFDIDKSKSRGTLDTQNTPTVL